MITFFYLPGEEEAGSYLDLDHIPAQGELVKIFHLPDLVTEGKPMRVARRSFSITGPVLGSDLRGEVEVFLEWA